jgi:hypothetical protein
MKPTAPCTRKPGRRSNPTINTPKINHPQIRRDSKGNGSSLKRNLQGGNSRGKEFDSRERGPNKTPIKALLDSHHERQSDPHKATDNQCARSTQRFFQSRKWKARHIDNHHHDNRLPDPHLDRLRLPSAEGEDGRQTTQTTPMDHPMAMATIGTNEELHEDPRETEPTDRDPKQDRVAADIRKVRAQWWTSESRNYLQKPWAHSIRTWIQSTNSVKRS